MIDEEEAELRKEQLRLQNLALAAQLHDRMKAEQRTEDAKRLARDAGAVGIQVVKWGAIIGAALVALTVAGFAIIIWREGAPAREERERALTECKSGKMKGRVFVSWGYRDDERGSVDEADLPKMPLGTRSKSCTDVERGEQPY